MITISVYKLGSITKFFRTGHVSLNVYWWYFQAMTISLCFLYLVFYLLYNGFAVYGAIWLSNMAEDKNMIANFNKANYYQLALNSLNALLGTVSPMAHQAAIREQINALQFNQTVALNNATNIRRYYLWRYLGFGVFQASFVIAYSVLLAFMVARASRYIHMSMLGAK